VKTPQAAPLSGMTPMGFKSDVKGALQRKANAPLCATTAQRPCDVGLFSDDASQLDLIDMVRSCSTKR
jgi:hypothetical protein